MLQNNKSAVAYVCCLKYLTIAIYILNVTVKSKKVSFFKSTRSLQGTDSGFVFFSFSYSGKWTWYGMEMWAYVIYVSMIVWRWERWFIDDVGFFCCLSVWTQERSGQVDMLSAWGRYSQWQCWFLLSSWWTVTYSMA